MNRDSIKAWSNEAVTLLENAGLSPNLAESMRRAIEQHSGTKMLHEIAADLAEGLSHLPARERQAAQRLLVSKYGYGYDIFVESRLRRVAKVLKAGKVRNNKEYRELLDLLSDTTLDPRLIKTLSELIAEYELTFSRE